MDAFTDDQLDRIARIRTAIKELGELYMELPTTNKSAEAIQSLSVWTTIYMFPIHHRPVSIDNEHKQQFLVWAMEVSRIRYYFHVINIRSLSKFIRIPKSFSDDDRVKVKELLRDIEETWTVVRRSIPYSYIYAHFNNIRLEDGKTIQDEVRSGIPKFLSIS